MTSQSLFSHRLFSTFRRTLTLIASALLLAGAIQNAAAQFRVVGYFPSWQGSVSGIQFSKVTHVNYAFLLPNANGSLQAIENPTKLDQLVTAAHNAGVKVSIAVGGWNDGDDSAFEALAASSSARTAFVNNIVNFIDAHNLDGVDIDWEYPDTSAESSNYTTLMSQLATAMHTRGKVLTAAVIAQGSTADFISSSVFNSVDWLNVMNYDNNDFQHSTYSAAVSCYNYWSNRGLATSKTVMGLPFYSRPGYLSFAQLVSQGANPFSDTFNGEGYNGITTVSNKTQLAFTRAGGGIMMWELSQDATGANSLVSAIDRVVDQHQGGPDFSVSATPTSQSVARGSSTTYTVSISALNGFTGTVTFGVSGLPSGATASFSPTSVSGSGNSTLTVTTSGSTPANTSTLTITATSGSLSHTDTVSLSVTDFTVAATPSSRSVTAGSSTTFTVNVGNVNAFIGTVNLSVSGLPSGASGSFSPTSVTPAGSSTLTITTTAGTTLGTGTLTITGTSGSLSHGTNVTLTVNASTLPAPWVDQDVGAVGLAGSASFSSGTFTLNASGADIWSTADEFHFVHQGVTGDVDIRARVTGVEGTHAFAKAGVMIRESLAADSKHAMVALTASNGVTFVRRIAAAGTSTSSNFAGPSAPFWIRVTRVGNTFTAFRSSDGVNWITQGVTNITMASQVFVGLALSAHNDTTLNTSTFDNVSVTGPTPDFTIAATPSSRTITVGNSTTYTVNIGAVNGFTGNVDLTASGLPANATASFNPTPVTGGAGSSTLTITTAANTPATTSTITITGTSGALNHSTTVTLITQSAPVPDFSISATPSSQTVTAGGGTTYTVTISAINGFSGNVDLTSSGLPSGAGGSFNPTPVTGGAGSSTLTVTTATNTTTGTVTVTITGTSGSLVHSTTVSLTVNPASQPGNILQEAEWLAATTSAGQVLNVVADAGASGGNWVSLLSSNVNQFVEYTVTNVPAGTYGVGLLYKQHQNRGIHSLTVDGVKLDGDLNQYSNTVVFKEKNFGNITFTASGNHAVRLTVTGKDPLAGNHNVSADAFRLTATNSGWLSQDIGAVGLAGSFSQNGGTYTVAGSGSDIWTTGDQFRYAYQNVSGNVQITARVVSESQTHAFAKAGVMIRASLATNSVHAAVLLTPTNGVSLHIRPSTGATSINVSGWVAGPTPPQWVRLVRSGNTFTGFYSANGTTWTQIASTNVTMSTGATIGMAVSSHNNAALNTATIDNVNIQ